MRREARSAVAAVLAVAAVIVAMLTVGPAAAQPAPNVVTPNSTQRGPDPTIASIEATRGTFATAQMSVAAGNGFGGGVVYYPTDTSQGTWGALAIVPGYTAKCANEEAWMGPWLSSFGFVVVCIETNTTTDSDSQRAAELLAALNWLTTASPVKGEVDPNRLSVLGHSAGGAGAIEAAEQRPSLRAMIGLAPGFPGMGLSMASDQVPSLIVGGQADGTVTPSYLTNLYATLPASTQSARAEIAGASHTYYTHANNVEMKLIIPWLKVFLDSDTRYEQFLCPSLPDPSTISMYQSKCPYVPPGGGSPSPSTSASASASTSPSASASASASSSPPPPGACTATYQAEGSWPGGFQGQVTVSAGSAAINGWSVHWSLAGGQQITQVWNGTLSTSGSSVTVKNVSYNGQLGTGASTTFGFLANGAPSAPMLTCTSP